MKKFALIAAVMLVLTAVLSGCGNITDKVKDLLKISDSEKESTNGSEDTSYVPDYTIPEPWSQSYQDALTDKIPFSVDLAVGWEYRDLDVNDMHRRITVTFEMEASMIPVDPCFSYYRVDMIGDGMYAETIATGREFFSDSITEYVRGEEPEQIFMELFEADFKAASFKGKDKDYVVVSIPAAWEPDSSTMLIANDQGKLLMDTFIDKSHQVALDGDNEKRYMDSLGNANFFSFNEDSITYLMVFQRVDGVTYLKEYSIDIEDDQISSTETGKTYTTRDTVPDLPGISCY